MAPQRSSSRPSVRTLVALEAQAHRWPDRIVRELAGGLLVHDPADPEPVFNRLVDPALPDRDAAWRGWLTEVLAAFERLQRRPHLWLTTEPDDPRLERLEAEGFGRLGASRYMYLADPAMVLATDDPPPGVEVERIDHRTRAALRAGRDVAAVIADAFDLEPAFQILVEADVLRMLEVPTIGFVLVRLDGEPVATARRTTDGSASLLAAIGTRRAHRRRGFGRIVTAAVARDALDAGSTTTYLGVEDGNDPARHLYEDLGFAFAAGTVTALLRR